MPSAGKPGMEGRPACRQAGSEVFFATDCTDFYGLSLSLFSLPACLQVFSFRCLCGD